MLQFLYSLFRQRKAKAQVFLLGPSRILFESGCKPDSVEDDHSSRRHFAMPLKRSYPEAKEGWPQLRFPI
jgi:hypothetical protein